MPEKFESVTLGIQTLELALAKEEIVVLCFSSFYLPNLTNRRRRKAILSLSVALERGLNVSKEANIQPAVIESQIGIG